MSNFTPVSPAPITMRSASERLLIQRSLNQDNPLSHYAHLCLYSFQNIRGRTEYLWRDPLDYPHYLGVIFILVRNFTYNMEDNDLVFRAQFNRVRNLVATSEHSEPSVASNIFTFFTSFVSGSILSQDIAADKKSRPAG